MNWLKQLFSRRRLHNDLSDEIREHLEEKIEELVVNGIPRKEATAAARREFGNVTLVEHDGLYGSLLRGLPPRRCSCEHCGRARLAAGVSRRLRHGQVL
jgi:hypothetical protein